MEEQEAIAGKLETVQDLRTKDFWIGLSDLDVKGVFKWEESGNPVGFSHWAPGQPDNYQGIEDCVFVINIEGGWNPSMWADQTCSLGKHPLCKSEKGEWCGWELLIQYDMDTSLKMSSAKK